MSDVHSVNEAFKTTFIPVLEDDDRRPQRGSEKRSLSRFNAEKTILTSMVCADQGASDAGATRDTDRCKRYFLSGPHFCRAAALVLWETESASLV